jgi:hypothetical protein
MRLLLITLMCALCVGCKSASDDMTTVKATREIEIAPGKWLQVRSGDVVPLADHAPRKNPHELGAVDVLKQIAGSSSSSGAVSAEESKIEFQWAGKNVSWQGKEIPVCLREHESVIYMIAFDRSRREKHFFRFFKLNENGTGFAPFNASDFPKPIASQNMWMYGTGRHVNIDGVVVDIWDGVRNLDIDNPYFDHSFTAYMWYQIEKGVELYEMPRLIDRAFLQEYVRKYNPIALPTIVKDDQNPAEAKEKTGE